MHPLIGEKQKMINVPNGVFVFIDRVADIELEKMNANSANVIKRFSF